MFLASTLESFWLSVSLFILSGCSTPWCQAELVCVFINLHLVFLDIDKQIET